MLDIITKVTEDLSSPTGITAAISSILLAITTIVRLTPTPDDDKKIGPTLNFLLTIFSKTRTKGSAEDKVKEYVVNQIVQKAAGKSATVTNEIKRVVSKIENGEIDLAKIGKAGKEAVESTDAGKKMLSEIDLLVQKVKAKSKAKKA